MSPLAIDLLLEILQKDPSKRISCQDILAHPWMRCHNAASLRPSPEAATRSESQPAAGPAPCCAIGGVGDGRTGATGTHGCIAAWPPDSGSVCDSANGRMGLRGAGNDASKGVASARVFFSPENLRQRLKTQGFLDLFRETEQRYTRLLRASNGDAAGVAWDAFCLGLREMEEYLAANAAAAGPFLLGSEPGLAEASIAPALFRMVATLPALRGVELLPACEEMGLERLAAWLAVVLARPADVCDVATLPSHVYVALARKLHVTYEGPPTPSAFSPAASALNLFDSASGSAAGSRRGGALSAASSSRFRLGRVVPESDSP